MIQSFFDFSRQLTKNLERKRNLLGALDIGSILSRIYRVISDIG